MLSTETRCKGLLVGFEKGLGIKPTPPSFKDVGRPFSIEVNPFFKGIRDLCKSL